MKYQVVFFDLDGTLVDTGAGICESVVHAVAQMGWDPVTQEQLRRFVGPPLQESFMKHCGCTPEEADEARRVFRAHYRAGALYHAQPYDGIRKLCEQLAAEGFTLAVATNKQEGLAISLLEHFGMDTLFTAICGADEEGRRGKADTIRLGLSRLGYAADQAVLIGDSPHDARGAEQTGLDFVAVTYGYGFANVQDVAAFPHVGIADSPQAIRKFL